MTRWFRFRSLVEESNGGTNYVSGFQSSSLTHSFPVSSRTPLFLGPPQSGRPTRTSKRARPVDLVSSRSNIGQGRSHVVSGVLTPSLSEHSSTKPPNYPDLPFQTIRAKCLGTHVRSRKGNRCDSLNYTQGYDNPCEAKSDQNTVNTPSKQQYLSHLSTECGWT